jgi:predicted extracellular nuclease
VDEPKSQDPSQILIDTRGRYEFSTSAGNLMAHALVDSYELDMAFYPSAFLRSESFALITQEMSAETIEERVLPLYPEGDQDFFQIGTMKGSQIRKFLMQRTLENYRLDLQVAGVEYAMHFEGGLSVLDHVQRPHGLPIDDSRYYRVAISDYFFFHPDTFPGYRFRNGLEQGFDREEGLFSAREALKTYLRKGRPLPLLEERRAEVQLNHYGQVESPLSIPEIQGTKHLSPYMGFEVTTEGVITALARKDDGTLELYVQSVVDDGDPRTSNALNIYVAQASSDVKVGSLIRVRGYVFETQTAQGLTRTSLRDVSALTVLATNQALPEPILVGGSGLKVPSRIISSYRGNVNNKESLTLEDGLDFWESLEGMRVKIAKPRVVGFRGGQEKFANALQYMAINVVPEGASAPDELNTYGGALYDPRERGDYNPEVIRIPLADLAPAVKATQTFNVGDAFAYDVEGILSFETNTFGDGEFVLYVTGEFGSTSKIKTVEERPQTALVGDADHVTVSTFNVENLAANETERLQRLGEVITYNLQCPDVIVLPEIQDNNGIDFSDGSRADRTLSNLITALKCPGSQYRGLNIDPIPGQDGGQPGGNIRVAMIYNAARLGFDERGQAGPLDETLIGADGRLTLNPGRLFPNDPAFRKSRKSLVAEFSFNGQLFTVIGNHTNSKLGDPSPWAAKQPADPSSELARIKISSRINKFASLMLARDPKAHILVAGDFNAYHFEKSMQALAGSELFNLMTREGALPSTRWFSSNYDGNMAAIDHILASQAFIDRSPEFDIVHVNSPFMGKISDHDPVIARFRIPRQN